MHTHALTRKRGQARIHQHTGRQVGKYSIDQKPETYCATKQRQRQQQQQQQQQPRRRRRRRRQLDINIYW